MPETATAIDLNLYEKLQDKDYRQKFFLAESSANLAKQLIELRKRRGLNQSQVAGLVGTKQPAISRTEQADYQVWNFKTLRSIATALDARIRIIVEPAEDVLDEYKEPEGAAMAPEGPSFTVAAKGMIESFAEQIAQLSDAELASIWGVTAPPSSAQRYYVSGFGPLMTPISGISSMSTGALNMAAGGIISPKDEADVWKNKYNSLLIAYKEMLSAKEKAEKQSKEMPYIISISIPGPDTQPVQGTRMPKLTEPGFLDRQSRELAVSHP